MNAKQLLSGLPKYLPATTLCEVFDLNPATLRVILHRARKLGVEPPPRKRFARRYFYQTDAFADWIWSNAETLRGQYSDAESEDETDAE